MDWSRSDSAFRPSSSPGRRGARSSRSALLLFLTLWLVPGVTWSAQEPPATPADQRPEEVPEGSEPVEPPLEAQDLPEDQNPPLEPVDDDDVEADATPGAPAPSRPDGFPDFNVYLPEGELDIKVRRLIRNALFEGQVNYNFVDGDISTFLRYKYYSRNFTYKLSVFDELEFDELGGDTREFDRVRGALLLLTYPQDRNRRYTLLQQVDSLAFGDLTRPDNDTLNVYTKVGYQFGTETDERLNSIVGESRGRIIPVLTAYRDIGPRQLGYALAATWSNEPLGSDFNYVKLEGELLKRRDLGNGSVLFSRLHAGTFAQKTRLTDDPEIDDELEFLIPRDELFRLGGRDLLKGVGFGFRGTDEIHFTNEYLVPVFRNRAYQKMGARWRDLFAIGYAGVGTAVFETSELTDTDQWVVDVGIGFETSFHARDTDVILTVIYAQPIHAPDGISGGEFRVSGRTVR